MHLRSLRIRGFKSLPDSLEISLEPGVAVIVGLDAPLDPAARVRIVAAIAGG